MSLGTKELQALGWLKRPKAEVFFMSQKALQERYGTFDRYAIARYEMVRSSWNKSSARAPEINPQNHKNKPRGFLSTNESIPKINKIIIDETIENSTRNTSKSTIPSTSSPNKIIVKKFKTKNKKKNPINYREKMTNCPNCLSKLVVNDVGIWECTGDKLQIWDTEFLKYNQLSDSEKTKYLLNFSHPNSFIDLYDKWSYIENGKRVKFECGYSNKLFNPISRFRTTLADPILINVIEKSLGRELTEEEIEGDRELFREYNTFFEDWKKGRKKVKIPKLTFPDGFI